MLLQPFIENAIWHGLMPKEGTKKLLIKAYHKNDLIYCIIEDNGVGRSQTPKKDGHISRGQEMTNGVFQLLASKNSNAKLEIIDLFDAQNNPAGTRVEIVVPLIV
jgi:sensor histidine kinase YesM